MGVWEYMMECHKTPNAYQDQLCNTMREALHQDYGNSSQPNKNQDNSTPYENDCEVFDYPNVGRYVHFL